MKYKNTYGTVSILDDEKKYKNRTIGISMSGGADSTILCYMVAKTSYQRNLNITIQPWGGLDLWAPKDGEGLFEIIKFIKNEFPTVNIRWPMVTVFDTQGSHEDHKNTYIRPFRQTVVGRVVNFIIAGGTSGPPLEAQQKFTTNGDESLRIQRLPGYRLYDTELSTTTIERMPFKDVDKRFVLEMYKMWNLVPLLEKTWSCTQPVETPCGGCWWCQERAWTVRQVFGDKEPQLLIYEKEET